MVTPVRPPPNVMLRGGLLPEEHARATRSWRVQFFVLVLACVLFFVALGVFFG